MYDIEVFLIWKPPHSYLHIQVGTYEMRPLIKKRKIDKNKKKSGQTIIFENVITTGQDLKSFKPHIIF